MAGSDARDLKDSDRNFISRIYFIIQTVYFFARREDCQYRQFSHNVAALCQPRPSAWVRKYNVESSPNGAALNGDKAEHSFAKSIRSG
jgi:hypothetical protein